MIFELDNGERVEITQYAKKGPPWIVKIGTESGSFPNALSIQRSCIYFSNIDRSILFKEECRPFPSEIDSNNNINDNRKVMLAKEYWRQRREEISEYLISASAFNFKNDNFEKTVRDYLRDVPDELFGTQEVHLFLRLLLFASDKKVQLTYKDYFALYQDVTSVPLEKIKERIVTYPEVASEIFDVYRLAAVNHQQTVEDYNLKKDYVYTLAYLAEKSVPLDSLKRTGNEMRLLSEDCAKRAEMYSSNICALIIKNILNNSYQDLRNSEIVKKNVLLSANNLSLQLIKSNDQWVIDICDILSAMGFDASLGGGEFVQYRDLFTIVSGGGCVNG